MCSFHSGLHAKRREAFFDAVAKTGVEAVCVIPAAPVAARNSDVEHDYRQDSDLFYLSGFLEPGSVLVLDAVARKAIFFVRKRDPERENWDGPRHGVDGVKEHFGADEAFTIDALSEELPNLFADRTRVYYRLGLQKTMDDRVIEAIDRTRARGKLGVRWPVELVDPATVVHEMRLIKAPEELGAMREAARITAEAHLRAMRHAKAGMREYEIEALILETFRSRGSERPAYGSIVGSGNNATILHYRQNNRVMQDGDLLLIDAGCEYDYLASDVTRTFPIGKPFSREQRSVYELVLAAQEAGIKKACAGTALDQIHEACVDVITQGLVDLGILTGDVAQLKSDGAYKPFFMHKTSHWLGMDVHDVGRYFIEGKSRVLAPGMVLTVEPGIYIAKDNDAVGEQWRGIGVRIEDDILVTERGPENLTADIPKTVAELERAVAA